MIDSYFTEINTNTLKAWMKKDKELNDPVQDVVKSIHQATVKKPVTNKQKLDDFDKCVVTTKISSCNLQKALKEKDIVASVSTVARTVKQLGFR